MWCRSSNFREDRPLSENRSMAPSLSEGLLRRCQSRGRISTIGVVALLPLDGQGEVRHEWWHLQLQEGLTALLSLRRCIHTPFKRVPAGYSVATWTQPRNTDAEMHRLCVGAQGAALPYAV